MVVVMIVVMVMTMIVMVVIVTMIMVVVIVAVVMIVRRGRLVGAALRLERRLDGRDLRAEALQQRLDRRIALEPELALHDLHRHVTVAEMPGEPRQRRQVGRARLDQRLGLGHHLDQPAVVEHQRVVGAKPHRLGEIELDAGALDAEQEALLRLALRVRQDQRVGDRRVLALGCGDDAGGAGHGRSVSGGLSGRVSSGRAAPPLS